MLGIAAVLIVMSAIATKHIFAGTARINSKLQPGTLVGGKGGGGGQGGGSGVGGNNGGGPGESQGTGRGDGLPPGLEK